MPKANKIITIFEHQRLYVGQLGFKQKHLDALLKLNELHGGTYFEAIAKGIKFNQYVGVIQVANLTLEIHPKADKDDDEQKWKSVLLQMLQACGQLKPKSTGIATVKKQNLNLLEVYFELFLNEVNGLIHKGLVKQYRKQTSNTKALKGKLEFANHIQKNSIHKERFYTTHQVYDTNHLLHQVLAKALQIVSQFTNGTHLYSSCKRTQLSFPETKQVTIAKQQLETIKLNRKTQQYNYALELARLIILNYSPDISSGKEKMLSILFDMNNLWETYILKQLQKACVDTNISVSGQESKSFWSNNSLRPDIVIRKDNEVFIIDTKWKQPQKQTASVNDLRQMYTYCRFWDAKKAILLYPGDQISNSYKNYKTVDYTLTEEDIPTAIQHQCKMSFISVLNSNGALDNNIGEKILNLL